jgi:two-component system cell cycle sensor histidine kinase/response regulator CckA
LGQGVLNLAVNARDTMAPGGTLTIETANIDVDDGYCLTHADSRPGPHVMLAVTDTGSGMDAETQARVFEPFFTTKPPGYGTGLGLPTVYGIVKQSGGGIWLHSELGKGTSFRIYLPRTEAGPVPRALGTPEAPQQQSRRQTVLVVEGEPALLSLVTRILGAHGHRVLKASSGSEARQQLLDNAGEIDLLLTDVMLPGSMQGHVVARHARPDYPDLRVLFMSAYTREVLTHDGRLEEGINFIEKPFTPDALAAKVREVLDGRSL